MAFLFFSLEVAKDLSSEKMEMEKLEKYALLGEDWTRVASRSRLEGTGVLCSQNDTILKSGCSSESPRSPPRSSLNSESLEVDISMFW